MPDAALELTTTGCLASLWGSSARRPHCRNGMFRNHTHFAVVARCMFSFSFLPYPAIALSGKRACNSSHINHGKCLAMFSYDPIPHGCRRDTLNETDRDEEAVAGGRRMQLSRRGNGRRPAGQQRRARSDKGGRPRPGGLALCAAGQSVSRVRARCWLEEIEGNLPRPPGT